MKLQKNSLVDINCVEDHYVYIYAFLGKSFFKKVFFKVEFTSIIPHYFWTDIQKAMLQRGIYWEDLVEGEETELEVGTIIYNAFNQEDFDKYGNSPSSWKPLLHASVSKQVELKEDYERKFGKPEMKVIAKLFED